LVKEHLEYWTNNFNDFSNVFNAFRKISKSNLKSVMNTNVVIARPVPLVPAKSREFVVNVVNYPNPLTKMMFKMGFQPDQLLRRLVMNLENSANDENDGDEALNGFFLQSML
jgi:hypothetical protein